MSHKIAVDLAKALQSGIYGEGGKPYSPIHEGQLKCELPSESLSSNREVQQAIIKGVCPNLQSAQDKVLSTLDRIGATPDEREAVINSMNYDGNVFDFTSTDAVSLFNQSPQIVDTLWNKLGAFKTKINFPDLPQVSFLLDDQGVNDAIDFELKNGVVNVTLREQEFTGDLVFYSSSPLSLSYRLVTSHVYNYSFDLVAGERGGSEACGTGCYRPEAIRESKNAVKNLWSGGSDFILSKIRFILETRTPIDNPSEMDMDVYYARLENLETVISQNYPANK